MPLESPCLPLTPDQVALVDQYIWLAVKYSRPFVDLYGVDRDERESLAMKGLLLAVRRYEEQRGIPFPGYLRSCVTGKIRGRIHQLRRKAESRERAGFNEFPTGGVDFDRIADHRRDASEDIETADLAAFVASRLDLLTDRERDVLTLTVDGQTQLEIGQRHGVTKQCISQTLGRIRKKMLADERVRVGADA